MARLRISPENKTTSETISLPPKYKEMLLEIMSHYNMTKSKMIQELIFQEHRKINTMID
jgi:hypothetical protein